jgi:chemotaxis protein methyltransferase CheR
MTDHLSQSQLSQLSDFVATHLGLNFPQQRWPDLERQTISAAEEFGFSNSKAFLHWLLTSPSDPKQVEMLASHLTVAETYFWREPKFLEALRDTILPDLIRARETSARTLRIWSAGCASGEEPYSIAIMLRELIPALKDWRITLLATDINPRILRRAALGLYGDWSFRNVPPGFKEKYFTRKVGGKYEILPEIRHMVSFAYLNLAEDIYPSTENNTNDMDLILCRNVLMYFVPERARQVGQHFYQALSEDGSLVVGASELSQQLFPQFAPVQLAGAFIYRCTPQPALVAPEVISLPAEIPFEPDLESALSSLASEVSATPKEIPSSDLALATLTVRSLANQGNLTEALTACEKALTIHNLDAPLHYLHALILQEKTLDEESKTALKRALYLDPSFVLAHFTLGNLAQRQGDSASAQKYFKNALELLSTLDSDEALPEAEGLTVDRLEAIIRSSLQTAVLLR